MPEVLGFVGGEQPIRFLLGNSELDLKLAKLIWSCAGDAALGLSRRSLTSHVGLEGLSGRLEQIKQDRLDAQKDLTNSDRRLPVLSFQESQSPHWPLRPHPRSGY